MFSSTGKKNHTVHTHSVIDATPGERKEPASYPGPFLRGGGERAWYTLHAHAPGTPEKSGVIAYGSLLLCITLSRSQSHVRIYTCGFSGFLPCIRNPFTMNRSPADGNHSDPAHAHAMCTRPFPLLPSKKRAWGRG